MDLSGHQGFAHAREQAGADDPKTNGRALLALAWAALSSARAESVDISLRHGAILRGVRDVRVRGALAEARTSTLLFDHGFLVADVIHVRLIPRGG